MVILFLTSCLEPGKDGVGDYTRRLAVECVRQGHACHLLALNDPHLSVPVETTEAVDGGSISILRLPTSLSWEKRVELAAAFRERQPLDWISLQFVAYGFDRQGIVKNLPRHLEPIVAGAPLHLMCHELWIGGGRFPRLKDRVVGQIQRYALLQMIRQLQPRLVTSTNPFYRSLLEASGVAAMELPLFGNIPIQSTHPIPDDLVRAGLYDETGAHPDRWLGLFFGALYPEWKREPFLTILMAASAQARKRVCLVSVGRLGGSGEAVWKKLARDYAPAVDFISLGEQSPRTVSALLQMADFGLAASPWYLLGKSGAVAAMLDHGLPVIVTREETPNGSPTAFPQEPLLYRCDAELKSRLVSGLPKRAPQERANAITHDFIGMLNNAKR